MVMSQAAIGALMAQNADGADAEADDQLEASDAELNALTAGEPLPAPNAEAPAAAIAAAPVAPETLEEIDPLPGALSAEEIAIVQAAAADPTPSAEVDS